MPIAEPTIATRSTTGTGVRRDASSQRRPPGALAGLLLAWAALALGACGTPPSQAEPDAIGAGLDGHWIARVAGDSGQDGVADLRIHAGRGVWTPAAREAPAEGRPCDATAAMSATLVDSGHDTVTLRLTPSADAPAPSAQARCAPRSARLARVSTQLFEGEFEDGRLLRLSRRP